MLTYLISSSYFILPYCSPWPVWGPGSYWPSSPGTLGYRKGHSWVNRSRGLLGCMRVPPARGHMWRKELLSEGPVGCSRKTTTSRGFVAIPNQHWSQITSKIRWFIHWTENQQLSWCQLCYHWWHHWLLEWQLAVSLVKIKLASWQFSVFSVVNTQNYQISDFMSADLNVIIPQKGLSKWISISVHLMFDPSQGSGG